MAGESSDGSSSDFALLRYTANGTLDTTFQGVGFVLTDFQFDSDLATGIGLQSNGRIVLAGSALIDGFYDFAIAGYTPNGDLDLSFGLGSGKVVTSLGPGPSLAFATAVQADGKVLVAGSAGTAPAFAVVRYTADGARDATFNSTGSVTTPLGGMNDTARAVAVQSDGKIVVAGYASNGSNTDFALVRYNSNGSLDLSFNGTGKVTTPVGTGNDIANAVVIQPDGKIVAAGAADNATDRDFAVVRYESNGTLDTSFNGTGKVMTPIGTSGDVGNAVALQADGKIVVAGTSSIGSDTDFAVVRYRTDGTLDPLFNGTGKVTVSIGAAGDDATGVAVQANGRIVVAGTSAAAVGAEDIALVRLLPDGSLDTSFDGGRVTTSISTNRDFIYGMALQSDGKILVAGGTDEGSDTGFAILRYLPTGLLDLNFSEFGIALVDFGLGSRARAIALQGDGKIVAAGLTFSDPDANFAVVRLLADPGPTVTTLPADFVSGTQALLHGTINPNGEQTLSHFEYGTDPNLTTFTTTTDEDSGSGVNPVPLAQGALGLVANTTYYFRAKATNASGSATGQIFSFVTGASPPAVTTQPATAVRGTSAILHASVNPSGQPTNGKFEYGIDIGALTESSVTVNLGDGNATVPMDIPVGGLTPGRTYYFRGTATNVAGTSNGAALSFTTSQLQPGDVFAGTNLNIDGTVLTAVVQPDGKIFLGGDFTTVADNTRKSIARLNRDGSLDFAFSPDVNAAVSCIAVQSDGKIVIGGKFTNINGTARNRIARLMPDGTVDTSFQADTDGDVIALAVQADGKIVFGGDFNSAGGQPRKFLARVNADSSLDPLFAPDITSSNTFAVAAIGIQPDGKLVVGGTFTAVGGTGRNRVARLNNDGSLDASFDPGADSTVLAIAIQTDGSVVLGGGFTTLGGGARHHLGRVSSSGVLDASFIADTDADVITLAIQADGRIVAGGAFLTVAGTPRAHVARLLPSGALDTSFIADALGIVQTVSLAFDGSVLLGGSFGDVGGTPRARFAVAANAGATENLSAVGSRVAWLRAGTCPEAQNVLFELSTNGGSTWTPLAAGVRIAGGWEATGVSLPPSGAVRARARIPGGGGSSSGLVETVAFFPAVDPTFNPTPGSTVRCIGLQPDGKIVIGGAFVSIGATQRNHVARLNADGSLDAGFDPDFGTGTVSIECILVQPDGSILVGGMLTTVGGVTRNGLVRITPGGALDTAYNPNIDAAVQSMALQPDGKLVIGGTFGSVGGVPRLRLARLNTDGTLDTAFDPGVPGVPSKVECIAVQENGQILIGGFFDTVAGDPRNFIARINPDGTLDNGFAPDLNQEVTSLVVQPDGKIVIAGSFNSVNGIARNRIARLEEADGALDLDFNPNSNQKVDGIVLQADGQMIVSGQFNTIAGANRTRMARLNSDGSIDPGFDPSPNSTVVALAIQADGAVLVGGGFTSIGGASRPILARLNNGPAAQVITVPDLTRVQWARGGTSPEAAFVSFELSTDGGSNWSFLGNGARMPGGWSRSGLTLPSLGMIRARAFTVGSFQNGSAGLVESIALIGAGQVVTLPATEITGTTATLHGTINPNGLATSGSYRYGTDPALDTFLTTTPLNVGSGSAPVPLDVGISGLASGTTYYFQAVATSTAGTQMGIILSFTTLGTGPAVSTDPATAITFTAAVLHANVNPRGSATTAHFEYSADPSLTNALTTSDVSLGSGQVPVPLDQVVTGLTPGTEYYFRAVATNAMGTSQGAVFSFFTPLLNAQSWDLVNDWSDLVNPNGVWSYNVSGTPLTSQMGWGPGMFPVAQPVWSNGVNGFPVWFKVTDAISALTAEIGDAQIGDVLTHTSDNSDVTWTSPDSGMVDIVGGVWTPRALGRSNHWSLTVDGDEIANGNISAGDVASTTATSRSTPMTFAAGLFKGRSLERIPVNPGTVIRLRFTTATPDYVGVFFSIVAGNSVVFPDNQVPGEDPGTVFVDFGAPTVEQGMIGGAADIQGPGVGRQTIIYGGADGSVLARTGGVAPNGAVFIELGDPVFGGTAFGFQAKTRQASPAIPLGLSLSTLARSAVPTFDTNAGAGKIVSGLWSKRFPTEMLRQIAVQGGPADEVSGTYSKMTGFGLPRNRAGLVYIAKLIRGGGITKANDFGVWREKASGDGNELLLRTGDSVGGGARSLKRALLMTSVPKAPDQRRSFAADGSVAASATFNDGTSGVVLVDAAGTSSIPLDTASPVPMLDGATWDSFGVPAVASGGRFAVRGKLKSGAGGVTPQDNEGVFASLNGGLAPILRRGATFPTTGAARVNKLGEPLLGEGGLVGLLAALKGPGVNAKNRDAIVIHRDGEPIVAARLGDPAKDAGSGVVYTRFLSVVVTDAPQARLLFTAIMSGPGITKQNRQAIWAVKASGEVELIVRLGQTIPVGNENPSITLLDALKGKPANRGQGRSTDASGFVTARVKLSNGRNGVLRVPIP